MRHALSVILALFLLGVGCARGPATPAVGHGVSACDPPDLGGVRALLEAQAVAWNRGDLDGFLAGYERTDALVFTGGGQVRRGFDEAQARYRARYGDDTASMGALRFELLDVRPLGACGAAAVVLGRWHLTGGAHPGSGVFTVVLEHGAEGWRIVHDHSSADPPP